MLVENVKVTRLMVDDVNIYTQALTQQAHACEQVTPYTYSHTCTCVKMHIVRVHEGERERE